MDENTPNTEPEGFNRRDMLRRSALVGGALIWTAPAVQTLAAPAFAAGSPVPGNGDCEHKFFVKLNVNNGVPNGFDTVDGSCGSRTDPYVGCDVSGTVTVTPVDSDSATISIGNVVVGSIEATMDPTSPNCVTVDFSFTNGCNINEASSYLIVKQGQTCTEASSGQLLSGDRTGDRYRLCSAGTPGAGLSHVDLCICLDCDGV